VEALAAIPLETRRFEDLDRYQFEAMIERRCAAEQHAAELLGGRTVWDAPAAAGPDSTPGRSPSHKSSTTSATTPSSRSPTPSARPAPPPTGTSTTRARASARPFTANRRATPEHQSAETSRRGSLRKWRLVTRFLPRPQIARRRRSGGRSGQAATAAERRSGGTHYLTDHTQADLAGSGIHLPPLASYVDRLVEFMELHPEIGSAAMTQALATNLSSHARLARLLSPDAVRCGAKQSVGGFSRAGRSLVLPSLPKRRARSRYRVRRPAQQPGRSPKSVIPATPCGRSAAEVDARSRRCGGMATRARSQA
jgi:hypothetical protein